jgi:hypothetical protein
VAAQLFDLDVAPHDAATDVGVGALAALTDQVGQPVRFVAKAGRRLRCGLGAALGPTGDRAAIRVADCEGRDCEDAGRHHRAILDT